MKYITIPVTLALLTTSVLAQVGVNNNNPEQALDVGGKVKLADDATAPSEGTLRYNAAEDDFEGHDGTTWKSLTESRTDGLPAGGARLLRANTEFVLPQEEKIIILETRADNVGRLTPGRGEYFLVTCISVFPSAIAVPSEHFRAWLRVTDTPDGFGGDVDNSFSLNGSLYESKLLTSQTPLLVVGPFEYLVVRNGIHTDGPIDVQVRGYWVDSLDF